MIIIVVTNISNSSSNLEEDTKMPILGMLIIEARIPIKCKPGSLRRGTIGGEVVVEGTDPMIIGINKIM
jgi:hypothetical protein